MGKQAKNQMSAIEVLDAPVAATETLSREAVVKKTLESKLYDSASLLKEFVMSGGLALLSKGQASKCITARNILAEIAHSLQK